jgi:hypothetical protein
MKKKLAFTLLCVGRCRQPDARGHDARVQRNHVSPATNEPALEWVELHNQMAVDLDISDWRLSGDINFKFPVGTRAPGRGFIVVAANPTALMAATGLTNVFGPVTNRLANSGGTLEIRNNSDRVLDRVSFGVDGEWPGDAGWLGRFVGEARPRLRQRQGIELDAERADWRHSRRGQLRVRVEREADRNRCFVEIRRVGHGPRHSVARLGLQRQRLGVALRADEPRHHLALQHRLWTTTAWWIAPGGTDPHYILTAGAQGTPGANAIAILNHPTGWRTMRFPASSVW